VLRAGRKPPSAGSERSALAVNARFDGTGMWARSGAKQALARDRCLRVSAGLLEHASLQNRSGPQYWARSEVLSLRKSGSFKIGGVGQKDIFSRLLPVARCYPRALLRGRTNAGPSDFGFLHFAAAVTSFLFKAGFASHAVYSHFRQKIEYFFYLLLRTLSRKLACRQCREMERVGF
jgi:hypothetical protein